MTTYELRADFTDLPEDLDAINVRLRQARTKLLRQAADHLTALGRPFGFPPGYRFRWHRDGTVGSLVMTYHD